jgi:hypothetical protein
MPKENEPKERASVSLGPTDYPVLLEAAESLKTCFAQTVQTLYSAASAVLGCVTMGKFLKVVLHWAFKAEPTGAGYLFPPYQGYIYIDSICRVSLPEKELLLQRNTGSNVSFNVMIETTGNKKPPAGISCRGLSCFVSLISLIHKPEIRTSC